MMDQDVRKELRDYAWKYFEIHADQRLKTFHFYIIFSTLLIGAFAMLISRLGLMQPFAILPFTLVFLSFVFWKLEERTRMLIKNGERALKHLDVNMDHQNSKAEPHLLELFAADDAKTTTLHTHPFTTGHFSYARCFRWVFVFFGVLGVLGIAVCFAFDTPGVAEAAPKPVDIATELSEEDAKQLRRLLPWAREAQVYALGEYIIIAPAADPGPIIYLQRNRKPFVMVDRHPPGMPGLTKEGQVVISLFRNGRVSVMDTGTSITISETANEKLQNIPRVSLSDFDGDGVYDRLVYSAFDEEGNVVVDVTDFDLDGQADFKLKQKGNKTESFAWIETRWRLIEKKNGAPGVLSEEGKWKPIERQGATWKYID